LPEAAVKRVFEKRYADGPVMRRKQAPGGRASDTMGPGSYLSDEGERILFKMKIDQTQLDLIKEAYYTCHGAVADMVEYLNANHRVRLSRRRISKILDALGLLRLKRQRL
jgi:hypothetical protein